MPVTKVVYHPPREFEVNRVEAKDGLIEIEPVTLGRNVYTPLGHMVVEMDDGFQRASRIEVNPHNGETRITRLTKPGEKAAGQGAAPPSPPPSPAQPRPAPAAAPPADQAAPSPPPAEPPRPRVDVPGPPPGIGGKP